MIKYNDIRYTGRGFEAAVTLPGHDGPQCFACRVDGPAALDPGRVQHALLGHALRQQTR